VGKVDLDNAPISVLPVPKAPANHLGFVDRSHLQIAPTLAEGATQALSGEVWINPPADGPEPRMLQLPRDTNFVPQLSQSP
jgi:hypothetical protein